ncbi:MAG: ParB N-terminal domain-containing protein [Bacteroidia bacterium]|nr:ParB N-terminal domain-containing protein [Bacteroidia bacterium]MDW8300858.1 ParB N-terminal domain-containing protein [Bacteroidia bacterium]
MAKKEQFVIQELQQNAVEEKLQFEKEVLSNIVMLPELKSYIPKLHPDEFVLLEANIRKDGCREPLVLWANEGKYVIVDGHNRYSICQAYKIPFRFEIKNFESLDDVKLWMLNNQLGKRNLTDAQRSYLRGKQYELEKLKRGRPQKKGENVSSFSKRQKTVDKLAEQHKVSDRTIKNDERYAKIIDRLSANYPELKWKILNQDVELPKTAISFLESLDETNFQKVAKFLAEGRNFKKIVKNYRNTKKINLNEDSPKAIDWDKVHKIYDLFTDAIKTKNEALLKEIIRMMRGLD